MDDAGTVPPQLWAKVDNLTVKIGAMLLPLFNVIREASPETTAEWETFYKRLHAIVSKAAWINVAASIKTIIMVIEWATPGEPWERGQFNIWADGYEASKAQAKKFDKACGLRWSRMARVKISAVPKVTLISNRDDAKPGYMCWNVQEAQAVFYHGFLDVNVNDVAWVPLLRHVELLKHARPTWMGRVVEPFARVIVLAMLVYGLTRVLLGVIPGGIASIIPDVLPDVIPGAFRDGVPPFINALNTLGWRIWSALP